MLGSEWTRDADASITQWVRCARRSGAALQGLRCTKCRAMHEVSCVVSEDGRIETRSPLPCSCADQSCARSRHGVRVGLGAR